MKNSKLALLLVLVAGIWGTIGYRIYVGMSGSDSEVLIQPKRSMVTVADTIPRLVLSLNYPDPFLKGNTVVKDRAQKTPRAVVIADLPASNLIIQWDQVEYNGSILNKDNQTLLAAVRINGVDFILKEGEEADHFVLNKIFRDSIKVSFDAQQRIINKLKQ